LKTITKKLYEAMFVVDSSKAASDWERIQKAIEDMVKKSGAELVSFKKWDERRLAYEIRGRSRGTYILCYFRSDGNKNHQVERDVQLSELIMRVLILSADHVSAEEIEKATPAEQMENVSRRESRPAAESTTVEPKGPKPDQDVQAVAADVSVDQEQADTDGEASGRAQQKEAPVEGPGE
jgi:small subunit ribosomal protein S6